MNDYLASHDAYFFLATTELHELGHLFMKRGDEAHHTANSGFDCCVMTTIQNQGGGRFHLNKMCGGGQCTPIYECNHWGNIKANFLWDEPSLLGGDKKVRVARWAN